MYIFQRHHHCCWAIFRLIELIVLILLFFQLEGTISIVHHEEKGCFFADQTKISCCIGYIFGSGSYATKIYVRHDNKIKKIK
jgi:hypothetical protein